MKKRKGNGIPRQYRTDDFKKLQSKWYDKLERKGFSDLEWQAPGGQNSPFLKKPLARVAQTYNDSTAEHYRRCGIHLHDNKFKNKLDRFIFECYTEGQSYRTIIKSIVKRRGFRKKPYSVYFIYTQIHRLLNEMNEKRLWEVEEVEDEVEDEVETVNPKPED